MTDNKYAPTAWGKSTLRDVTLPSGQVCQIRPLEMEDIIQLGLMDIMDAQAMQAAPQDHLGNGGVPQSIPDNVLKDGAMNKMIGAIDDIIPGVVVQPTVRSAFSGSGTAKTRVPENFREQGVVYTDQISMEDKFELFSEAMGGIDSTAKFSE